MKIVIIIGVLLILSVIMVIAYASLIASSQADEQLRAFYDELEKDCKEKNR